MTVISCRDGLQIVVFINVREVITVWNEEMWVERIIAEDAQAFEDFIEHYKAYVFAIIFRFVNSEHDAQDIAQEVFLQVYRSIASYQSNHFKAWVGKIATNKAIDWKRKQSRIKEQGEPFEGQLENIARADEPGLEEIIIKSEGEAYLRRQISSLSPAYRKVLIKHHFQEKSYQQIAREEGISIKTVESRLYRARKLLRQRWKEGR